MSTKKILALRLSGVLQSWGYNSEYTYRNSGLFPTKSAILGLVCAAKGLKRGSLKEHNFLETISDCPMTAISLPRLRTIGTKSWPNHVRRIVDLQTIEKTKTASGKPNPNAVMTYRQYLCDADFIALLEVDDILAEDLQDKLSNPQWGIWLGRKSCIPTAPVFAGVYDSLDEVSEKLLDGQSIKHFTHQKEVTTFEKGSDSLMDIPIDYAIDKRVRSQRRVKIYEAEK